MCDPSTFNFQPLNTIINIVMIGDSVFWERTDGEKRKVRPKMKIFVKTLKGSHFEIEVKPEDSGADIYPAGQQMLIHQGKVLKDETTLAENNVADKSFVVIMLSKNKASSSGATTVSAVPSSTSQPVSNTSQPTQPVTAAPPPAPSVAPSTDVYGEAASNLVAGSNLEATVQQILDMGGGSWDRDTVVRALRAAFNNPERAVEYLYSGIPEQAEVPPVAQPPAGGQSVNPSTHATQPVAASGGGPNANPLDLFPQGLPSMGSNASAGNLDFLRNSPQVQRCLPMGFLFGCLMNTLFRSFSSCYYDVIISNRQFQALRAMVQANPQILQPMLQELGKQNPQLVRLIQEHQADFLRLINEPVEGEGNILGQLAEAMPQAVTVTPEEREAIERLEAMGFDRALVLEVFFACNKNEELAANYLLDHMHEFDD
ncbi:hypothetical protein DH2020_037790 [Rehmannia glutinosa]|uniref:Ubiquitin receptor RAD23 n=1 Tax=Rehmannia glutinosa TaxID=99300 RepID=A0ABR0V2E7_REHGL